jgi:hypothetical protein
MSKDIWYKEESVNFSDCNVSLFRYIKTETKIESVLSIICNRGLSTREYYPCKYAHALLYLFIHRHDKSKANGYDPYHNTPEINWTNEDRKLLQEELLKLNFENYINTFPFPNNISALGFILTIVESVEYQNKVLTTHLVPKILDWVSKSFIKRRSKQPYSKIEHLEYERLRYYGLINNNQSSVISREVNNLYDIYTSNNNTLNRNSFENNMYNICNKLMEVDVIFLNKLDVRGHFAG